MDRATVIYSFFSLVLALILVFYSKRRRIHLPPSPPSLPLIGHLHLLKQPLHRTFHRLSQRYGPVICLRFASRLVVVVSSPSAVEECFTKNDVVLANRPQFIHVKHMSYNYTTVSTAPYGDHWRNLRRICAVEIFSTNRLDKFLSVRKDEIRQLLKKLARHSTSQFAEVELKSMFQELTFNIIMRMISGKSYYGENVKDEEEARIFREVIAKIFEEGGASYPGDYFPMWNWVTGWSYERKAMKLSKSKDAFLQKMIDQYKSRKENGLEKTNSMIDHMLSLQESQPEYYTDEVIKALILVMLLAGTDTSAVTLEWAMSNLLNHPDVLKKAKAELDTQLGPEHLIEESDVSKLHYLKGIISETLRLYPTGPLLVPHMSSADCRIGGYGVPRGTIVFVNAWAIHRDPKVWDDATSFKPERFESGAGEGHKLMPFGLGRRACPGADLAHRVMGFTLGSLIQCFEWERVSEKEIDMTEGKGLTMPKVEPLKAMCKTRQILDKLI